MSYLDDQDLFYFEADSMKELFETIQRWQQFNNIRFRSTSIERDNGKFCCIALRGRAQGEPVEVVICNGKGSNQVSVWNGELNVDAGAI